MHSINRTVKAAQQIRALLNPAIGREVRKLIHRIAQDPIGMTKGEAMGVRAWDGMLLADGEPYYVVVSFIHADGSASITLTSLSVQQVPGPH